MESKQAGRGGAGGKPSEPDYLITFLDFGNQDVASAASVRAMEPALAAVPPQAQLASLAYLKVGITLPTRKTSLVPTLFCRRARETAGMAERRGLGTGQPDARHLLNHFLSLGSVTSPLDLCRYNQG